MEKLRLEYQEYKNKDLSNYPEIQSFYDYMIAKYNDAVTASNIMGLATTAELRRYCQTLDK